jgi:fermentation-respiration switch protein FrsA (DUF1100 family)
VPSDVRRQADTTLFKSWLTFDPATVIPHLDQPLLIVQGALDTEFPVANADRLETLSRARTKLPATATTKVIVPGVNHRLVPATTGERRVREPQDAHRGPAGDRHGHQLAARRVPAQEEVAAARSILVRIIDLAVRHHDDARRENLFDLDRPLVTREHVAQSAIDLRRFVRAAAAQDDSAAREVALHGREIHEAADTRSIQRRSSSVCPHFGQIGAGASPDRSKRSRSP